MGDLFDFTTDEVLDWEIDAIWVALDADEILISRHAQNETGLDGLSDDEIFDTIGLYDTASKDLPGNDLNRAPGINFERQIGPRERFLVKVGSKHDRFYVVVTAMIL